MTPTARNTFCNIFEKNTEKPAERRVFVDLPQRRLLIRPPCVKGAGGKAAWGIGFPKTAGKRGSPAEGEHPCPRRTPSRLWRNGQRHRSALFKEMRPRAAKKNPRRTASGVVERAKGVEPSYQAWEACVLPMNYARGNEFIIPQIFDFSRAFLHDGEKSFRQGAAKRDSGGAGPPLSGRLGLIPFSRIWPRPDGRFAGDWCRRRCGDGSPPDGA